MTDHKNIQTKRAAGFYVVILAALLCLASAIAYSVNFRGVSYTQGALFSDQVFIGLIAASVVSVIMLFVKLEGFAPVVLCIVSGVSTLVYIHRMVWPISDIFVAIDPVPFVPELVTCGAMLLASFVLAEISLYMKKRKVDPEAA
ncbi:MAG: hypothetical protein ACOYI5_02525 [Christensenellales bacterium]|jgi:hypothetical protein